MNLNGMVSMWKVRELVDKATNIVMNYTETEAKVREATNDDPWGPSGAQMQEIAAFTFAYEAFPEAVGMLWKRMLQDNKQNWRRVYKSLLLLDYLLKNGSERVVTSAREHIYDLRGLENFSFVDENGKDQGINIRHKVTDMLEFIQDDDRLREERKKAKKNKDKYVGMSSDMSSFRGGGGGGGGGESWGDNDWKNFDSKPKGSTAKWDTKDSDEEPEKPDVAEFTDDWAEPKQEKKVNLPRRPSGGAADWPSNNGKELSTPSKTAKGSRPIRKVDLGASASYGKVTQQQQPVVKEPSKLNNNIMEDLFSNSQPKQGQLVSNANDFVADFDDFDPRAGESLGNPISNPLQSSDNLQNNNVTPAAVDDDFADFSSAFSESAPKPVSAELDLFGGIVEGSSAVQPVPDLFGNMTAVATPTPTPVQATPPTFDIFGGGGLGSAPPPSAGPSSMDLLSGLSMTSLPPPTFSPGQLMEASPSCSGPPSLPPTVSAFSTSSSVPAQTTTAPNVGSTWSDLGSLNSSLLNFSLDKKPQKPAAVSMAAMAANTPVTAPPKPGANNNNLGSFAGLDGLL